MPRRLPGRAIQAGTITVTQLDSSTSTVIQTGGGPKITNVQVTDASWTVLDDTAVDTAGGNILITGTGFVSGCLVYIGQTPANSVGFVSSTQVRVNTPALTAGTYPVYLSNPDGGTAIRLPGVTASANPAWQTASALPEQYDGVAITLNLVATDATSYTITSGSLPPGLSLNANTGVISGIVSGVSVDTTYTFTVRATDAQLQDSPRTFTVTITVSDPYFKLTTLLLSGSAVSANTVIRDSSTNNFNLTVSGDARASNFTPYGTGWSVYFDGTGDSLSIANTTALQFGTGDFTVEAWVYLTATPGAQYAQIIGRTEYGSNGDWMLQITNTRTLTWYMQGSFVATSIGTILLNTWTQVAATRSGSSIRLFINGTIDGTATNSGSTENTSSGDYTIGADQAADEVNLTGYISNLRVIKGTALYTANFTPATTNLTSVANTSLLTCNANRFLDSSTNNFTITRNGDARVVSFNPFNITNTGVNGSMYFDGTGDYCAVAANSAFSFPADFTWEAWAYPFGMPNGGYAIIYATGGSGSQDQFGLSTTEIFGAGTLITAPIRINTWMHCVICRQGSTVRYFVNGILVGTLTNSATIGSNANNALIGIRSDGLHAFQGYIADLRIIKGTALYTANFTPPTQPLAAVANTQLLILQYDQPHNNHGFLDSSSNQFVVNRAGNASQGTFSPFSQSGWSVLFTRSNNTDRVLVSSNAGLGLQSNNFTVELWAYFNSAYTGDGPFCVNIPSGGFTANTWWFGPHSVNSGRVTVYIYNFSSSGPFIAEATSPPVNQWVHYALVRSSNTFTIYRNGVATATGTFSGAVSSSTSLLYIGRAGDAGATASGFDGYISNLRIVNGVAVYTGAFTPPTVQLTITQSTGANIAAITGTQTGLLCLQSNRLLDNSTFAASLSMDAGSPKIQAFSPFAATAVYSAAVHGGSVYYDASGDSVTVPSNSLFSFPGDFCIEAWVYPSAAHTIAMKYVGGDVGNSEWYFAIDGTFQLSIALDGGGSEDYFRTATNTITPNAWNHCVATRSGTAVRLFINGVLRSYNTTSKTLNTTGTQVFMNGNSSYQAGFMITRGAIPALYQTANTTSGTAIFTPSSTVPAATANTSILLKYSDAAILDSTGRTVLETVADAKTSSVVTKFAGGSMSFDGTGDAIIIRSSDLLTFGTGDWTVEFWVYHTSVSGQQTYLGDTPSATSGPYIYKDSSHKVGLYYSTQILTGTTTIAINTWYYIVLSRASGTVRLFINGIQETSASDTTNLTVAIQWIGGDTLPSGYLSGYMNDIRVTKGYARYTANFTAPTIPARLK